MDPHQIGVVKSLPDGIRIFFVPLLSGVMVVITLEGRCLYKPCHLKNPSELIVSMANIKSYTRALALRSLLFLPWELPNIRQAY